jgi:DNA-binding MarR family transcriptional regulator
MNYSVAEHHDQIDALVEEAMPLLPEIGKLLYATIARYQHSHGLSLAQIKALAHIVFHHRRTVGEIAGGLGVSMPAASEVVDRLVEAGLAERGTNPADRRQVLVWPTPEAERIGAELRALRRSQLRAALERLTPEDRPSFVRSLAALVEALRQTPDEPPAACPPH